MKTDTVPFISGIALMVVPYFVGGTGALVASFVALMALPYYIRSEVEQYQTATHGERRRLPCSLRTTA
jgi:hypothetical protein